MQSFWAVRSLLQGFNRWLVRYWTCNVQYHELYGDLDKNSYVKKLINAHKEDQQFRNICNHILLFFKEKDRKKLRCYNLNEVYPKIDSNHVLFFLCLGVYITPSDTLFWTDLQKVNFLDFLLHYYMLDVGQSKAAIVHNVVASIELYV